jgi:RNA polymerase sigma-70 factor (ECF subfamily)
MSTAIASLPAVEAKERLAGLFVQHYRRVLIAAHRITGSMADAEDVAQALFMRLGSGELPSVANVGSYLYRAAINGALDLLRRRKTAAAEPLDAADAIVGTSRGSSPEAELSARELGHLLRQAMAELTPRAAEIFALRYLEDLNNREIAETMGMSPALVAVILYQSRSKLKQRLGELHRGMR